METSGPEDGAFVNAVSALENLELSCPEVTRKT